MQWQFQIRHAYNPSSGNNWAVFLFSDKDYSQMQPAGTANGYLIGVNYTGSDDLLKLWKVSNGTASIVLQTDLNWQSQIGTSQAAGIEVVRKISGEWTVKVGKNGGFAAMENLGTATDSEHKTANYFGVYYEFSSAQDRKLRLDDLMVVEPEPDTTPPEVIDTEALSPTRLQLAFSEAIEQASAESEANYLLNGSDVPTSATLIADSKVELLFAENWADGADNTLNIQNLKDRSENSNTIANTNLHFTYTNLKASQLTVVSANQVDVLFTKVVEKNSAETEANYLLDNSLGNPSMASLDTENKQLVHLEFLNSFPSKQVVNLSINNVNDLNGNAVTPANLSFTYYHVEVFDVVINEILADPEPAVGLPAHEFVELYNTTDYEINLQNWIFKESDNREVFPAVVIPAHGYLILCNSDAQEGYEAYGQVAAILNRSTLSKGGEQLQLISNEGDIISRVHFSDDWFSSSYKTDGGWSLEQIDPTNPCGGAENWTESNDVKGGTPGAQNQAFANNPDELLPALSQISITDKFSIVLHFNKLLNLQTLSNTSAYVASNGLGTPILAQPLQSENYDKVELVFGTRFDDAQIYTLTIGSHLRDCADQQLDKNTADFAFPQEIAYNDVVINELLFNPYSGGSDFVELYNRSQKVISLDSLLLGNRNEAHEIDNLIPLSNEGFLLFPETYLLVTEDMQAVENQYYIKNNSAFFEVKELPSYPDERGSVVLSNQYKKIIDDLDYSEDMQFQLLNDFSGVSLERIDPEQASNKKSNWHSAAGTAGFATPTYKNSQYMQANQAQNDEINIEPKIFSPDNDGYNDQVNIHYKLAENGWVANIHIYDAKGRLMKRIAQNELLETEGTFAWNGLIDSQQKAPIGMYIIYIELFDLNGNVKKYKKSCVLASKLN